MILPLAADSSPHSIHHYSKESKHMKKIISIVLALMLVASFCVTAFAAENIINNQEDNSGSITINGITEGNTYDVYKLLHLESYDKASGAYSYKASAAWADFFQTEAAKAYFTTDASGYVSWTWMAGNTEATTKDEAIAAFAKLALKYAKEQDPVIEPVRSSDTEGDFTINGTAGTFSGLELGYYLVDSTVGALCGLTTTNPNASINAKNGVPTIDKQVKEDSTSQWGDVNSADIGQVVEFRVTINVHAGAENYVLHDTLGDGFTFQEVTQVEHVIPGKETHVAGADRYSVETEDIAAGCTFDVVFSQDFCDDMQTNDKIVVTYKARLNRHAIIAGSGNTNTAWLTFGEGHSTAMDSTTTYTYSIDIVKTDSQNTLINGAKFRIYDASANGNEIKVVPLKDADEKPIYDSNGNPMYRRAREDETGVEFEALDGIVSIVGFDNGTYYLEETEAPDGYNKLAARQKFIISDRNLEATFNGDVYSTGSGVHVVNKTGSMLPETGGIGTLLFTLLGGGTALGAGAVLVAKKRVSKIEDAE